MQIADSRGTTGLAALSAALAAVGHVCSVDHLLTSFIGVAWTTTISTKLVRSSSKNVCRSLLSLVISDTFSDLQSSKMADALLDPIRDFVDGGAIVR